MRRWAHGRRRRGVAGFTMPCQEAPSHGHDDSALHLYVSPNRFTKRARSGQCAVWRSAASRAAKTQCRAFNAATTRRSLSSSFPNGSRWQRSNETWPRNRSFNLSCEKPRHTPTATREPTGRPRTQISVDEPTVSPRQSACARWMVAMAVARWRWESSP